MVQNVPVMAAAPRCLTWIAFLHCCSEPCFKTVAPSDFLFFYDSGDKLRRQSNLFIYQARVQPGPSRVSDSPVSAENVIYEAFVLMGELRWTFSYLLQQWRKIKVQISPLVILLVFQYFPFPGRQQRAAQPNSPHQNKGFINYVFCRNWAVRNPAGTRLDSSSLVNKQVEQSLNQDELKSESEISGTSNWTLVVYLKRIKQHYREFSQCQGRISCYGT